ncbi:MAG: hypothetical protein ACYTEX_27335, partial [Planctomycetota bacterium]
VGSAGEAQAYLDVGISSRAAPGNAMDLVADAVDSGSLATSAVDEIVDQVWRETLADHSGVVGSTAEALDNVAAPASPTVVAAAVWDRLLSLHVIPGSAGVILSGRAAPGDAMDLVADAVDASAMATSGVNEIRDAILSDSTPFAGANIDAAVSSRAVAGDAMALTAPAETALVDAIWRIDAPGVGCRHLSAGQQPQSRGVAGGGGWRGRGCRQGGGRRDERHPRGG